MQRDVAGIKNSVEMNTTRLDAIDRRLKRIETNLLAVSTRINQILEHIGLLEK